ncbi:MAG: hypothetical protein LR015_06550 [Verrucomicrobia bacterium]|nr:hypothetical protein [Verrucomicrobiota bacterium]
MPTACISRRRFLKIGSLAVPALWLPACLRAGSDSAVRISVLHSTDLHAHILPTVAYDGTTDVGVLPGSQPKSGNGASKTRTTFCWMPAICTRAPL